VGLNAFGASVVADGLSEQGLAGGILYLPGFAGYTDPSKSDPAHPLAAWDFLTWALTNFATVAEDRATVRGIHHRRRGAQLGEIKILFDGRLITYAFGEPDQVILAYATTIHKSPGHPLVRWMPIRT
jgi:hypothetical protein